VRWLGLLALAAASCAATPEERMMARARELIDGARTPRGDLLLRCKPEDAEVALDGVAQGRCSDFDGTPGGLKVGEGMHRVDVTKEGFYPYQTYYAPSGGRAALTITLRPLSEGANR
jgi:hypothetical protein